VEAKPLYSLVSTKQPRLFAVNAAPEDPRIVVEMTSTKERLKHGTGGSTMIKHIWWGYVIKVSVAMICWTLLAIYFEKWWIALFATLFLGKLQVTRKTHEG
jgi:hypothetical protein